MPGHELAGALGEHGEQVELLRSQRHLGRAEERAAG
jgi:hypothetical protein